MSIRQQILIAVANGCRNIRQVAEYLDRPHGTIAAYLYGKTVQAFDNGDLLQWTPDRANTLRLGPNAAVIRRAGKAVEVGKIDTEFRANVEQS